AVLGAEEVHEGAEVDDLHDLAGVDHAQLGFRGDGLDPGLGGVDLLLVVGGDLDGAVIADVDLGAGLFDDLADHLAARTDHFTDLVGRDLHGFDLGSVLAQLGARGVHGLRHFVEDVEATGRSLRQSLFHDLFGDAVDLDVHLQAGDAFRGTGYLEIHIAEVIFVTQDVGQNCEALAFLDQAHGDTGNRRLHRHAGVHQGQRRTADRGHRGRTVGLGDLRHHADGVGEVFARRQHRTDGAPGQLAVTDFATARRAHAAGFTDRIGREVVVQQEGFFVRTGQGVDELFVFAGAERGNDQGLGFAAREQRRTVGARQDADFRDDGADLVQGAAVDAVAVLDNVATQDVGFAFLERSRELGRVDAFRLLVGLHQGLGGLLLGGVDARAALILARVGVSGLDVLADQRLDRGDHVRVVLSLEVERFLGGVLGQVDDGVDDRLHARVREHQGLEHLLFRQLLGFGFDHHQGVLRARDDQIQGALAQGVDGRVQHQFAVDHADACAADRAHERHARDGQGGRGGDHAQDVGIVLKVVLQHGDDDLGLVLEALDEQRADRTVDQAGDQGLLLGRTAFTLEVAARDLAGGVRLFLIVDGQGEEIQARLGLAAVDDGGQDHGLAVGRQHGAVGLTGDAARLQGQRASGPLDRLAFDIEHISSFVSRGRIPVGGVRSVRPFSP
uniref:NAD-specific glutamate dehydrogenase n=1 Tax=Parastrongyloides trichosuri TaxID=131310 RepID=A0A0N4ZCV4_PARTI